MRKLGPLLVCIFLSALAPLAAAQTTVHHYRYSVGVRAPDPLYVQEVSANASGTHYIVETDAQGRITRVTTVRNGKTLGRTVYRYEPGKKFASGYEWSAGDEPSGRAEIKRNADGLWTRVDRFTLGGQLTGYTSYSYLADSVEWRDYTALGKLEVMEVDTYSTSGRLVSLVRYNDPDDKTFHVDGEYDENTGQERTAKQFRAGKLTNTRSFTYNADGDLIRRDEYDPSGRPYVMNEYVDGLRTRKQYKAGDQVAQEFRYTYDEKRWLKETGVYYKGDFVCRFIYDRLPDGTVKRTVATGPNGDLWAEYPDRAVADVARDGKSTDGKEAVIHKTGNWW